MHFRGEITFLGTWTLSCFYLCWVCVFSWHTKCTAAKEQTATASSQQDWPEHLSPFQEWLCLLWCSVSLGVGYCVYISLLSNFSTLGFRHMCFGFGDPRLEPPQLPSSMKDPVQFHAGFHGMPSYWLQSWQQCTHKPHSLGRRPCWHGQVFVIC